MFSVKLVGMKDFLGSMRGMSSEVLPAAKEVLYAEAQGILRESRKEVPFLHGILSSSGRVHEPYIASRKAVVEITYGGAAGGDFEGTKPVNYAILQHENENFRHAPGRKAWYLRDPVNRARDGFSERLNRKLARLLAGKRLHAEEAGDGDS